MPIALNREIRKLLETAVKKARLAAEAGAQAALGQLGVADAKKPSWLSEADATLRVRLRAHARALGDPLDTGDPARMSRLVREIAYAHWHRALFTRFLLENGLLVDVDAGNAPVRSSELREIAEAEDKDVAAVAAEFARPMLPEIFPKDDPVLALPLPPETRQSLAVLVDGLPTQTFIADDSLGWTYQYWQADRKKRVNESEVKIGADELPAVTQLFTEDYMVLFLLENTLGAWWAGKKLAENTDLARDAADEDVLRQALSPPGYAWTYLRFRREDGFWRPAAGTFPGWPARAAEITMLDPCMGSGHFLVFALDILVALRKAEEGSDDNAAVVAVLRDNLHGLEIDPRCTQIAAFALALAAWKRMGGVRSLPALHLACSGLAIGMGKAEFLSLSESIAKVEGFAGGPTDLLGRERNPLEETALARRRGGLERLYDLFAKAPVLGSLIDPHRALGGYGTLFSEGFEGLTGILGKVLNSVHEDADLREAAVMAQGLAKAAGLLSSRFTLVATNVPYLGKGKMEPALSKYCDLNYANGGSDLATVFFMRIFDILQRGGSIAVVSPQNWLALSTYTEFRKFILKYMNLSMLGLLGTNAFQDMNWWAAITLLTAASRGSDPTNSYSGVSVGAWKAQAQKEAKLAAIPLATVRQVSQYENPDNTIGLEDYSGRTRLSSIASCSQGISPGDSDLLVFRYWELDRLGAWAPIQYPPDETAMYAGRSYILRVDRIYSHPSAAIRGEHLLSKKGFSFGQMNTMPVTVFEGVRFSNSSPVVTYKNDDLQAALWCFFSAPEFRTEMKKINEKSSIDNGYFTKVPFDLPYWQSIAAERYPDGLPKPYSNNPTQWLFDGHPRGSANPNVLDADGQPTRPGLAEYPLQVAVARMLGYRWPRQTGSSFMDCPAVDEPDVIDRSGVISADGIVCLPAIHGEAPCHERLRAVLMSSWNGDWGEGVVRSCLEAEGWDKDLESWLADGFFEGHCRLFHQAPFVWHVWDGIKGGFSAFVNYHKLSAPGGEGRRLLEKLRDTYLGQWIGDQRRAAASDAMAEDRLAAAQHLFGELTRIIEGEPPYDIFVRWKPLHEQPIGWEPDIDDGVRLNIRPFLVARPRGKAGRKACILRVTPGVKKHEGADRGGEPQRGKADYPWFWAEDHDVATEDFAGGPEFKGRRYNDFHYRRAFKEAARIGKAGPTLGSKAAE